MIDGKYIEIINESNVHVFFIFRKWEVSLERYAVHSFNAILKLI